MGPSQSAGREKQISVEEAISAHQRSFNGTKTEII